MPAGILGDALLDAQLLRVMGSAPYGGADRGECLAIAGRIQGTDIDGWFTAWTGGADEATTLADVALARGDAETARAALFRASNYHRNAGVMLLGSPVDPRLVASHARQTDAFRRAAALLERPPELVEIPFEGASLPGYFFRAAGGGRRATVILTGGYDGTAEELYFFNGAAALARGYHVLAFDGPGQGAALLDRGLVMRPEWETVIAPVIDHLVARPYVDPARIALIGLSLGAHLGPRAASAEHRLAACIADCGSFDLHASFLERLPGPLAGPFDRGNRIARAVIGTILGRLARKPTAGWALRRGMLVHGTPDVLSYVESLRAYSLAGRAERIACPTWVCSAEGDDIGASAPRLVAALTVDSTYVRFTTAEGAGDHCEVGARELYHARSFGWLDARLRPSEPA